MERDQNRDRDRDRVVGDARMSSAAVKKLLLLLTNVQENICRVNLQNAGKERW